MDVLIGECRVIGAGHLDEIQGRLEALEGDLDGATLSHLRGKLDVLRNLSPQAEPETSRYTRTRFGDPTTYPSDNYVPARPDPEYDYFTWTLPSGASPLRLSLPADIDDFLFGEHGGIGGFGLHAGGHVEGLDHPWIELKPSTPVRSWADGVVVDVRYNGPPGEGEYHVTIDYGYNLTGVHMEMMTPYVEKGDKVLRGQEVGTGMSFDPYQTSAELTLVDRGRTDGVRSYGGGVNVSPFDYLEPGDKAVLVDAYKRQVIEPYVASGVKTWGFEPYQPYLTNNLFLHDEAPGRLHGAWYLISSTWEPTYPNDLLTFIEADNPYYSDNNVLATDDEDGPYSDWFLRGTFEADYEHGRLVIRNEHSQTYYGIFEINESTERARLSIEYRTGSYPASFSGKVLTYVERSDLGRRGDASSLGVLAQGD
ncbi:M23 family metallopeptidase [Chloroflexota bacterium]